MLSVLLTGGIPTAMRYENFFLLLKLCNPKRRHGYGNYASPVGFQTSISTGRRVSRKIGAIQSKQRFTCRDLQSLFCIIINESIV